MKAKLKKIVVPIFLSVVCGFISGRLMFSIYEDKENDLLSSNVVYLLEDATYKDYDTMKASTISSNYIYYEEDGKYSAVIAMTKDKENIKKIEDAYDKDLRVSEYLLSDKVINEKLEEYDKRLSTTSEKREVQEIILEMINIYKEREDVKMVKIS